MQNINVLGIDIAKLSFHVCGVNHAGKTLLDKKISRDRLLECVLNVPKETTIAMEACGGAHHWGRTFQSHGYEVKLIAPQFVKPFVKSHKNDRADAQAITEAASRRSMRFVPVKTLDQQDSQSLHRVREQAVKRLTAIKNEVRGILAEYGIIIAQGRLPLKRAFNEIFDDDRLTECCKQLLHDLYETILFLEEKVSAYTKRIDQFAKANPTCQALQTIPGVGPIAATAIFSSMGSPNSFKNGRSFAAWLGLVPKQHSTGGKTRLGRITKRGNVYLRSLLIMGARAYVKVASKHQDRYSLWVNSLREKSGFNRAAIALANRNARVAWALWKYGGIFNLTSHYAETVH